MQPNMRAVEKYEDMGRRLKEVGHSSSHCMYDMHVLCVCVRELSTDSLTSSTRMNAGRGGVRGRQEDGPRGQRPLRQAPPRATRVSFVLMAFS